MNQILDKAYQGLVNKASPTGLLPIWNKWVDKKVVKKYGFSYNVAKAKSILAAAGYKDTNGDGYVENKDGSPIDLKHRLPERVVRLDDVDPGDRRQREGRRDQDHAGVPRVRHDGRRPRPRQLRPAARQRPAVLATRRGRTTSTSSSCRSRRTRRRSTTSGTRTRPPGTSTKQLDKTPSTNDKAYQAIMSKLQTIFLQDLPAIPLWYNGMWSMVNTQYWTNWPSSDERAVHADLLAELLADDEHRHAHAASAPRARRRGAQIGDRSNTPPGLDREGCCSFRLPCELDRSSR